jgi:hypothetical protein
VAVAETAPTRAWPAPALAGALGFAGLAYLRAVDPAQGGAFPACPFHRVTGLWCPGCGMTRALHALLHGNVGAAISSNLFVPLVLLLGGYLWLWWLWPPLAKRRLHSLGRVPAQVWGVLVSAALAYGVLRNLPVAPFTALAP